jgi:putative toxin-antitoxin system antitoxin component (TIGR02293 family)
MADKMALSNSPSRHSLADWLDQQMEAVLRDDPAPLSVHDLEKSWAKRFTASEIEDLVIPRRTMARRKSSNAKLSQDEADRAVRLARVQTEADRVFGDLDRASGWMRAPRASLSGQSPLQLLKTEAGAKVVCDMLLRIAHGIYA